MTRHSYPTAPTSDQVDDYHGTLVTDPFRPLEDSDSPETRAWITAENALTGRILDTVGRRHVIHDRLAELWDYPRAGAPWKQGERWFQFRNTGLQDQDVLWTSDSPDSEGRVLFDPNILSAEGTTALGSVAVSESGKLIATALSHAGSDWRRWRVREVARTEDLPDRVDWSKFSSAAWTHDDFGFFYSCFPEPPVGAAYDAPNHNMEIRYHRLDTPSSEDRLVFARPDEPEWNFEPAVSEDGLTLVLTIERGTDPNTRIYAADLANGVEGADVRAVLDQADARYELVAAIGRTLYLLTDLDAPFSRLIAVDLDDPSHHREVIPEAAEMLERVAVVDNRLAAVYLHDAYSRLVLFELDGRTVMDVALPGIGSIIEMTGRRVDADLYLTFTTFVSPPSGLAVRMADGAVREVQRPDLAWNPDDYVSEQVLVTSGDGTRVPLFLTRRRDIVPNDNVATLLYGYGGFLIPVGPSLKPEWIEWIEGGGLLAVASLRGGGEYGTAWHDAGRLANKQNVFDDFEACMRWLASSGWTRPGRIGISGRSNGGLLVGASLTQHPELFGAAIAEVGVMDMLRFQRFTIGWGWTSDYGSSDDPEGFRTLMGYSPLHNIRTGTAYPATLVTTGDHDDRVVPGHSFKFAAALQAAQAGDEPVLIRIDTDAGHGLGKPVGKLIEERADVLSFLELALGPRTPVAGG